MIRQPEPVIVVGSGASGVHFALTLLEKGYRVRMLDVGRSGPAAEYPDVALSDLKSSLNDPARFFLGSTFEDVVFRNDERGYNMRWPWSGRAVDTQPPDRCDALHGFGQHLKHVFRPLPGYAMDSDGFAPVMSFARGGLAEAWAAGAFPFNEQELDAFPISAATLLPFYDRVAGRIGVSGQTDDLTEFIPGHRHLQPPLELNEHAALLLQRYHDRRQRIQDRLGCVVGRSRSATLTRDHGERGHCTNLGRCMTGCPREAIYGPAATLRECRRYAGFDYLPGWCVHHFDVDSANCIRSVAARSVETGQERSFEVGTLVLAAGTLASGRIVLESIYRNAGVVEKLTGLMDTRMLLIPFLTPAMLCRRSQPDHYQYHHLAAAIPVPGFSETAHAQITTMTGTTAHAVAQTFGLDLKMSVFLFRHVRQALGAAMVSLSDTRRTENYLTLDARSDSVQPVLKAHYRPSESESARIRGAVQQTKRLLRALGCFVPPGMVHVRPMGAGIHYAGTLPMDTSPSPLKVSPLCRSYDFGNLFVADGSTFPALPGKGLTFSLMANATRIAETAF